MSFYLVDDIEQGTAKWLLLFRAGAPHSYLKVTQSHRQVEDSYGEQFGLLPDVMPSQHQRNQVFQTLQGFPM